MHHVLDTDVAKRNDERGWHFFAEMRNSSGQTGPTMTFHLWGSAAGVEQLSVYWNEWQMSIDRFLVATEHDPESTPGSKYAHIATTCFNLRDRRWAWERPIRYEYPQTGQFSMIDGLGSLPNIIVGKPVLVETTDTMERRTDFQRNKTDRIAAHRTPTEDEDRASPLVCQDEPSKFLSTKVPGFSETPVYKAPDAVPDEPPDIPPDIASANPTMKTFGETILNDNSQAHFGDNCFVFGNGYQYRVPKSPPLEGSYTSQCQDDTSGSASDSNVFGNFLEHIVGVLRSTIQEVVSIELQKGMQNFLCCVLPVLTAQIQAVHRW